MNLLVDVNLILEVINPHFYKNQFSLKICSYKMESVIITKHVSLCLLSNNCITLSAVKLSCLFVNIIKLQNNYLSYFLRIC